MNRTSLGKIDIQLYFIRLCLQLTFTVIESMARPEHKWDFALSSCQVNSFLTSIVTFQLIIEVSIGQKFEF